MEKEEKVIDQTVDTSTEVNEDVIKSEEENIVDDNTTTEDSDVDEPVVSTEDQTLAPTDDVIPAPVDTPVVDEPTIEVPADTVDTPVNEPVADAPLADIVPPEFDVPVDAPVDAPVEVPGTEIVDPVIPEDPAPVVTDPAPEELKGENPTDVAEPCEQGCCDDPNCTCNQEGVPGEAATPTITIGQYFGTLQESVTIIWRFHLKTRKYSVHIALNEFYNKALDIVDDIIEQYQGICGVVEEPFVNCVIGEGKTEGEYITELKAFVENNRCVASCGHSEIDSVIDEFLGLIDSTNYKLVNLTENAVKSFEEFVYEDYPTIKESCCGDNGDSDFDNAEEE